MLCANEFIVKVAVVATAKTPWKPADLAAITKITRYEISRIDKKHLKIVNLKTFFSVGVGGGGGRSCASVTESHYCALTSLLNPELDRHRC